MTQLHRLWNFLSLSLLLLISPKIFQWVLHDEQSVQHSAPEVLLIILHSFL